MTSLTFKDLVNILPYVDYYDNKFQFGCDAWVTSNGRRKKCNSVAVLSFKAAPKTKNSKGRAKSGRFCGYHLMKHLDSTIYENARAERAYAKYLKEQEASNG